MNPIEMHKVKSKLIQSIGYDAKNRTLAVEFNGGTQYHYANVEPETFESLKSAESIGTHFGKHIKANAKKYPHKKIERKK